MPTGRHPPAAVHGRTSRILWWRTENGFKVYLCRDHHKDGSRAAHNCRETRELLCRIFQRKYEETHTREEFRALGIKNYLEDEDGDGVVNPAIVKIKVEGDGNEVN